MGPVKTREEVTVQREQIKVALDLLMDRVRMTTTEGGDCSVAFEDLDRDAMIALGIAEDVADHLADAPWWSEMIDDVAETPDFCEPGDTPEQVLGYARDVVKEYVWKRF